MIHAYTYIETPQSRLHEFVMAFFNRIEFETGEFSNELFVKEFYENLVKRHRKILGRAFKDIYRIIKEWDQPKRSVFCKSVRESNEIKDICAGRITPWKEGDIPEEIRYLTKNLFANLYESVLKGEIFQPVYGTRKDHYHLFKKHLKNNYEYCPACGIRPMHTYEDDITDQYDHYLPKDLYPFSSVNFQNLVPVCTDCNSFQVKGNDDILRHTGKVFFPFDDDHSEIEIDIKIKKNDVELSNIEWNVSYSCSNGKQDEIEAWKKIYKIESRHKKHISGSIETWYKHYWNDQNNKRSIEEIPDKARRTESYLRKLKDRNILEYSSLFAIISSFDANARSEARSYSLYDN